MLIADWQFLTIIFLAGAYVARHEFAHKMICNDIKLIKGKLGIGNGSTN